MKPSKYRPTRHTHLLDGTRNFKGRLFYGSIPKDAFGIKGNFTTFCGFRGTIHPKRLNLRKSQGDFPPGNILFCMRPPPPSVFCQTTCPPSTPSFLDPVHLPAKHIVIDLQLICWRSGYATIDSSGSGRDVSNIVSSAASSDQVELRLWSYVTSCSADSSSALSS